MKLEFEYFEGSNRRRVTLGDDANGLPISEFTAAAQVSVQTARFPRATVARLWCRGNREWQLGFSVHRGFASEADAGVWQVDHIAQVTRAGTLKLSQPGQRTLSCAAVVKSVEPTWRGQSLILKYTVLTGDWA